MAAHILDGKLLAQELKDQLKKEIASLKEQTGTVPHLFNVMVGNPPGASTYAGSQKKAAEAIGMTYELKDLPGATTQDELIAFIHKLNQDKNITGIMIHKPLPEGIDYQAVANHVALEKDLEGANVANIGKIFLGEPTLIPCTAEAAFEMIKATGVALRGKEAVVIGVSEIVGKPLFSLLLQERATVTVCHRGTSDAGKLAEHVSRADIVVAAIGRPEMVKGEWIKKGAIVIDVGINHVNNKIVGDVEFDAAKERAGFITPVPGGVGPVTVVMLMRNGVEAFKKQRKVS